MNKRLFIRLCLVAVAVAAFYGLGRLYFQLTGGFTIGNITSDFAYHPEWETRSLSTVEHSQLSYALDQPYHYLGKGCQAYVFASQDGQYVVKFFKYQRYRLQPWLKNFPPLPAIVQYRQEKSAKKEEKLSRFVSSWKVAFEHLKDETGLLYVHLNKTHDLNKKLVIYDKIGMQHIVDLDQMEFCVQRKADMLCPTLLKFKENGDLQGAQELLSSLLNLILSEYQRGLADNDHALMQNTGVAAGKPIHIDVGQFVIDERVKEVSFYQQELFTKTYKFKLWLKEAYPELYPYLEERLLAIMGPAYNDMQPHWRRHQGSLQQ